MRAVFVFLFVAAGLIGRAAPLPPELEALKKKAESGDANAQWELGAATQQPSGLFPTEADFRGTEAQAQAAGFNDTPPVPTATRPEEFALTDNFSRIAEEQATQFNPEAFAGEIGNALANVGPMISEALSEALKPQDQETLQKGAVTATENVQGAITAGGQVDLIHKGVIDVSLGEELNLLGEQIKEQILAQINKAMSNTAGGSDMIQNLQAGRNPTRYI
ncbi:MAG: hypothetical protein QF685_12315 [Verrucomicrobiota bacterium]|nr:hypothetical protein [Verrucomicrobiota bacterium]